MSETDIYTNIASIIDSPKILSVNYGDEYMYVESIEDITSETFREFLSTEIVSSGNNYGLEVRAKDNKNGYVGIISENPQHPIQKATIFCGYLGLSDRETYQTLVKTSELVDEGLFNSQNHSEFAASVIQVLSTSFNSEPYDTAYLCKAFDLDANKIQQFTSKIVSYFE
jgi:hypothetical protein